MLTIKSKFVMKKITKKINHKRFLQLLKYNKKIQKKIYISIQDYRKYNQIEFELHPNNKVGKIFLNTINADRLYIHIYINDDIREKFGSIIEHNDTIQKIKIVIDIEIKSLRGLFNNFDNIKHIKCTKFNRKDIFNMSRMFYG